MACIIGSWLAHVSHTNSNALSLSSILHRSLLSFVLAMRISLLGGRVRDVFSFFFFFFLILLKVNRGSVDRCFRVKKKGSFSPCRCFLLAIVVFDIAMPCVGRDVCLSSFLWRKFRQTLCSTMILYFLERHPSFRRTRMLENGQILLKEEEGCVHARKFRAYAR